MMEYLRYQASYEDWAMARDLVYGSRQGAQLMDEALLKDCIHPDGSLDRLCPYLYWDIGDKEAVLDGEFSAAELRAIADHMEKYSGQNSSERP